MKHYKWMKACSGDSCADITTYWAQPGLQWNATAVLHTFPAWWRINFTSITSKVIASSGLDLNRDGRSDRGGLVSVHRQHGVILQHIQVDAVPLAIIETRTCRTDQTWALNWGKSMERRAELTWGNVDTRVLGLRQGHVDNDLALRQSHLHPAVSQRGEHQQPAGVPRPEGQTDRQSVAVALTRQLQKRRRVEKDGEGVGFGTGKRQVALKWMGSEKDRDGVTQTNTWAPEIKHFSFFKSTYWHYFVCSTLNQDQWCKHQLEAEKRRRWKLKLLGKFNGNIYYTSVWVGFRWYVD